MKALRDKTVCLVLFDLDGSVFHFFYAEVFAETPDTVVVKLQNDDEDYLETYSKEDGRCLDDQFSLDPSYIMINARQPSRNSFAHLPGSWWQS